MEPLVHKPDGSVEPGPDVVAGMTQGVFPLPDETWDEYAEYSLLAEPLLVAVIPLTQGKVAFVDRVDLPLVAGYTWHAARDKHNWYATALQNGRNRGKYAGVTSPYKGVYRSGRDNKPWLAQITVHRKRVSLGRYLTPEEAARSYDEAAVRFFGEFARTNRELGLYA